MRDGDTVTAVDALARLADAAAAGDGRALEAFVEASYDQVWRLCAALVDEQSADDLAQETYIGVVRSLPRFRGEASARTWLLSIARHVCLDELRARVRQRRRDAPLLTADRGREPVSPDASQEFTITDLVRRLEPERRAAFVITQMLGLSYEEAAQVCDCPTGTIRSRVARARADLLDVLAHAEADRPTRHSGHSSPA